VALFFLFFYYGQAGHTDLGTRLGKLIGGSCIVLVPLHVDGCHWVLLKFDIKRKTGLVFDPLAKVNWLLL
jgi:hypothetical protein